MIILNWDTSSAENPTPRSPYNTNQDCSQGICTRYCPQYCYIIFQPPPPFKTLPDDDSGTNFSPLIIAIIGILATSFLLVSCFTFMSKYCRARNNSSNELQVNQQQEQVLEVSSSGLDEYVIKSIAISKYKKSDGLIEGIIDCAVCLSEFQENEDLRLLPKCNHAFHIHCIDIWLRSHSICPLCRSNVRTLPLQSSSSSAINVSSLETRRGSDLVFVIDDRDIVHQQEVCEHVMGNSQVRNEMVDQENEIVGVQEFGRSISLASFSCQAQLLIADVLNISDDDEEELQVEKLSIPNGEI